ncbi:MAG: hypothetical protein M1828_005036 [Chrysothrix sp. TS-e1954]|nr:MAG: hypothetical protein M1828_005036 [Chrysothrix sp. TS-e1954]
MAGIIERLDSQLEKLFGGWNLWTSCLAVALVVLVIYPVVFSIDPDTHPLLLSRQAHAAPVREPGESAVYRSIETPHGFPLRSGLNVKEPGASRWSAGRDGDLRDVWSRVAGGALSDEGQPTGKKGSIMTVYGREDLEKHDLEDLSRQINILGEHIKQKGAKLVAVYLPNSVETLVSIFASSFYGFTPVLVPYGQSHETAVKLVQQAGADYLIAAAGSLPLSDLKQQIPGIKEVLWVVEKSSRQMDWSEPTQGAYTMHELIETKLGSARNALPESDPKEAVPNIATMWIHDGSFSGEAFSQQNIAAAIGAQITVLPSRHRVNHNDLLLPADHLSNQYVLVQTLAALYSNASVVFNSAAGQEADLTMATTGISPTIVVSSPQSLLKLHSTMKETASSSMNKMALRAQTQALDAGYMPPKTASSRLNPPVRAMLGQLPNKLRLLYTYERLNGGTPPISSQELSDLRAFTGARIIYALTAGKIAGAVTQSGFYDYRRFDELAGRHSHFGVPLSCVEVKLIDNDTHRTVDDRAEGNIVVSGPACLESPVQLGRSATFRHDGTLAFA